MRVSTPIRAQDRIEALNALAKINLPHAALEVEPITNLERSSLTQFGPIPSQDNHPFRDAVIGAGKYAARRIRAVINSFRTALVHDEDFKAAERDLAWTSLSRPEPDTTPPSAIEKLSLASRERPRLERRGWWTSLEEVAVVAAQEEHPIRLALGHVGKFLARMVRSLFRAVRGSSVRKCGPGQLEPDRRVR